MKRIYLILICSFVAVISIVTLFLYSLSPSKSGIKYEKSWVCNDYGITFKNNDQKFPHVPSENNGTIANDENHFDIVFRIGYGDFEVGIYGKEYIDDCGVETKDFKVLFSRNYEYTFNHNFIAIVTDVNDSRFEHLDSQTLIFTSE